MKCILASDFGEAEDVLTISSDVPKPVLDENGSNMLVRVEACSLSPGDTMMLSGACDMILKPSSFPFTPGMDICGIVEEVPEGAKYKVGDRVIASNGLNPVGGLAEYMAVDMKSAGLAPANVDAVQGAALPNSPMSAMLAARHACIKEGDRVLILGGSGGVGSSLVQLAKDAKASSVAATSTDKDLLLSLGADLVIDYREEKWWDNADFKAKPLDVVIDCVGTANEWSEACHHGVLKCGWKGGRYVAVASTDTPILHTVWHGVRMFAPVAWRMSHTFFWRFRPRYMFGLFDPSPSDWPELVKLVSEGRLKPVLDPVSPLKFELEDVKKGFTLQASKHAHGKVVIQM